MKAYPSYKESGQALIGQIPEHWESAPLKFIGNIVLGKMLTNADKGGYFEKPYLRAKNIGWEVIDDEDIKTMWFSPYEIEQYRLKQNDLLISEGGEVGRTAIWNNELEECYIQNSVHKVTINQEHNPRFYLYHSQVFGKIGYYDSIVNRVSIGHLTGEKLKDIRFVIPPLLEQLAIADFLDRKTAQIDDLIAKKQRQIDLLHEQRTALINQAVTGKLDLTGFPKPVRSGRPMKDSGVEWLSEIPSHWKLVKTKYLFRLVTEKAPDDNDMELLSLYTEIGVRPRKELEARGNKASTTDGYWIVKEGDIIINKLLAWMGAVGYSVYDGVTSPAYDVLQKIVPLNSRFYHYLLRCGIYLPEFKRRSRGIMEMRLRLYFDELGQIPLVYPPLEEQNEIVNYLVDLEVITNQTISKYQKQMELLQEYRTALISATVTGKIDVRNE